MGLLLATRVLPRGDVVALSAAREAIGDAFLARLLLPLEDSGNRRGQKEAISNQVREFEGFKRGRRGREVAGKKQRLARLKEDSTSVSTSTKKK